MSFCGLSSLNIFAASLGYFRMTTVPPTSPQGLWNEKLKTIFTVCHGHHNPLTLMYVHVRYIYPFVYIQLSHIFILSVLFSGNMPLHNNSVPSNVTCVQTFQNGIKKFCTQNISYPRQTVPKERLIVP